MRKPKPRTRPASFGQTGTLLLAALCLLALPASAAQVFHSPNDDGLPGSGHIATGGVQSVFLYLDGGPTASTPGSACNNGSGDEVCGFDLELTGLGGLSFSSFVADPGADLVVNFGSGSVRINGLDAVNPGAGPQRVGELLVNASGGEIELTGGETIGADLGTNTIATQTLVTVPEPGSALALACGSAALAALAHARRRRS